MPVNFSSSALIAAPGQQYALSSLLSISAASLPEYLVLTGFDLDRYTAASQHSVGALTGGGKTVSMGNASLVFTYTDLGYYNQDVGYLGALNYVASTDDKRSDYLSLYGYGRAGQADASQLAMLSGMSSAMQFLYQGSSYLGSLDVVTRSNSIDTTPTTATPNEIAAVAASFVGKIWSDQGCWVLVSNIATAAGAALPVSSAVTNDTMPPLGNGQWIVAYDSTQATAAQQQTWQLQLRPGDVVDIAGFCANHITTVVAGAGFGAMTIDNRGVSAGDGAANDIVIDPPLNVMDSLSGGFAKYVTIYRLDTPVITPLAQLALPSGATKNIAGLFSAADPAGKAIVSFEIYDSGAASGSFSVNGVAHSAHSAATALTLAAADLAQTQFTVGSTAGSGKLVLRAYNGSTWGDWQSIDVLSGTAVQAPTLSAAPGAVLLRAGEQVSLASLLSASSADAPILSYTIHDPADGGHIELNGAVNRLGVEALPVYYHWSYMSPELSVGRYPDMSYEVSAADFGKLSYVAGGVMDRADALTITANNGTTQSSLPVDLSILSVGMDAVAISHYLAPGTTLAASALFALSGTDSNHPLHSYIIALINPGPSSGVLNLNGASNGVSSSLVNAAGLYEVSPSDFAKLTYTVGRDADLSGQTIAITVVDSVSVVNTQMIIYNATAPAQISARADQVTAGSTVALSSLFDTLQANASLLFHVFDPQGGGTVNVNDATNQLGKRAQLGEYFVSAADMAKMSYTGGSGDDILLIATSADFGRSWAAEIPVRVVGSPASLAVAPAVVGFGAICGATLAADGNILITFSEAIKLGEGVITLANAAGKTVETYHAGSSLLSISGNVLSINPSSDLANAGMYMMDIAANAIKSSASDLYEGASRYSFSTAAASSPSGATLVRGTSGDDMLIGGLGQEQIDGRGGKDTVVYSSASSHYSVTQAAAGFTVRDLSSGSTDTLSNVARIQFADKKLALDLGADASAGQTAEILGAAFGKEALHKTDYVGIGLSLFDAGYTLAQVAQMCINTGLLSAPGNDAFVRAVWQNVVGSPIDATSLANYTGLLESHAYTQASLLALAAQSSANQTQINLIGLANVGMEYV